VVVSADATMDRVEHLLAAGATAYMTKPVEIDRILALIDEIAGSAGASGVPAGPAPEANGRYPDTKGARKVVLLVDDDAPLRRLMRSILATEGYDVIEASTSAEALSLLETHEVDLLLTDMRLPGMSGTELAVAVGARLPDLPVLFVSGLGEDEIERDRANTRQGFLQKPVTPDALIAGAAALFVT